MKLLIYIINFIDLLGPLIALACFWKRKAHLSAELRLIRLFCWVQVICNACAIVFDYADINNYWIYEINNTASFVVVIVLFARYLLGLKKYIVVILMVLLLACNLLSYYYSGGISVFNSYGHALCSLVIVFFSLRFFYTRLINMPEEVSIPETSIFWCVVGLFTYYTGAFFIFISYKYLISTDSATVALLWRFHNILLFIGSLYISYGILCKNYRTILSS